VAPGFHFRFAIPSRGDHRHVVRTTRHDTTLTYSDEQARVPRRALNGSLMQRALERFPRVRELFTIRLPTVSDVPVRRQPIPVTFTFQRQVAGACTSSS
jgi:hypothetical protein